MLRNLVQHSKNLPGDTDLKFHTLLQTTQSVIQKDVPYFPTARRIFVTFRRVSANLFAAGIHLWLMRTHDNDTGGQFSSANSWRQMLAYGS